MLDGTLDMTVGSGTQDPTCHFAPEDHPKHVEITKTSSNRVLSGSAPKMGPFWGYIFWHIFTHVMNTGIRSYNLYRHVYGAVYRPQNGSHFGGGPGVHGTPI